MGKEPEPEPRPHERRSVIVAQIVYHGHEIGEGEDVPPLEEIDAAPMALIMDGAGYHTSIIAPPYAQAPTAIEGLWHLVGGNYHNNFGTS